MRLIDADALKQGFELSDFDGDSFENIDNACRIVNSYPTIDAIPVEWLEEHTYENISDSDGNIYGRRSMTISEALSMWQKEQEAQK